MTRDAHSHPGEPRLVRSVISKAYKNLVRIYQCCLLYWIVRRFIYWFVADIYYAMFAPLYAVAESSSERASVLAYVARWAFVTHRLVPRRFLGFLLGDATLRVQGATYSVGLESDEVSIFTEIYKERVYDRVPDFIPRPGWTVVDVGANVGLFAVQQARRGARVFAFEPNPDCYRRLSKTIAANDLGGAVRAFNVAVGAEPSLGALRVSGNFTVTGSISHANDPSSVHDKAVTIVSLDDTIPSLGLERIDLLKIDTEGAEVQVLRGAEQTLQLVEHSVIEFHSWDLLQEVRALLRDHGFSETLRVDIFPDSGVGILYVRRNVAHAKS
jgi:FkbM family methyltransferase